jgi:phage tail-like protein
MAHTQPSSLLQYLPAVYREDPFLGHFLLAFEKLLFGLEQEVAGMATNFDPLAAPTHFLHWLASWTAFSLRFDLDVAKQRDFIANIIPLYRRRGTKQNLEELLRIFISGLGEITIVDEASETVVGGEIGRSTVDAPRHYFSVTLQLKSTSQEMRRRQIEIARAIIELEKPAHTYFGLEEQ